MWAIYYKLKYFLLTINYYLSFISINKKIVYGRRDSNTLGLFPKKSNNPLSLLPFFLLFFYFLSCFTSLTGPSYPLHILPSAILPYPLAAPFFRYGSGALFYFSFLLKKRRLMWCEEGWAVLGKKKNRIIS